MYDFKPFDKILVRDNDSQLWNIDFFSCYNNGTGTLFAAGGIPWNQAIPYEGNEHLAGTYGAPKLIWEPKPNELVAVSDNAVEWVMRIFKETIHENGTNRFITKIGKANSPTTISWRYCEPVKKHFDFILPE